MAKRYMARPLAIEDADTANVVELPNLVTGHLADLIASAAAPGGRHELRGEQDVRDVFRLEVESAPRVGRQWWRRPAIVVAASAASIMIVSTSLAAATGAPGPVAHIVNRVLGQPGSNPIGSSNTGGTNGVSVAPVIRGDQSVRAGSGTGQQGRSFVACAGNHVNVTGSVAASSAGSSRSCARQPESNTQKAGQGTTVATGTIRSSTQDAATGTRANRGTGTGTGSGTAAGTATGTGTNRGGNRGTGTGTGTNRGGNRGTGTGTGTNRGGNRGTGTGTNRGGNRGTGTHRGRRRDAGAGSTTTVGPPTHGTAR